MKVFKPSSKLTFVVSTSLGGHTHDTAARGKSHTANQELMEYIYNLRYEDSMRPRKIKQHLARNKPDEPPLKVRQIRYILKIMHGKKVPATFSYGEMIEWLKTQTAVPDSIDGAFVVDWMYNSKDDSFAFVISTRRLLMNAIKQKNMSSDGTYKINWQKFPLIVVGMIDRMKHLHVTGVVVSSNERESEYEFAFRTIRMGVERETNQIFKPDVIVSDHAAAIRNGFFAVFGPSQNVICSVHMFRKLKERSGYSSKINKQRIIDDVYVLHSSPDAESFDHAVLLFLEKWKATDVGFCTYFKSTWLTETTRNWYRGYSPFVPDNNNAMVSTFCSIVFFVCLTRIFFYLQEGTNLGIKRDFTMRELLPLNSFKITSIDMVHQMSLRYNEDEEEYPKQVAVLPKLTNSVSKIATLINFYSII